MLNAYGFMVLHKPINLLSTIIAVSHSLKVLWAYG